MGSLRGRQRRLEHFGKRAEAFARDIYRWKNVTEREIDGEKVRVFIGGNGKPLFMERVRHDVCIRIGLGKHRRLVFKQSAHELKRNLPGIRKLESAFKWREKNPKKRAKHFFLESLAASAKHGVQEYVDRPTLSELLNYLQMKKTGIKKPITKGEALRCKRLLGQFPGITLEELRELEREFDLFCKEELPHQSVAFKNVAILGQRTGRTGDGRIRIALVDL